MKLFRIWWGNENDRREIGHVIATDLDKVAEWAKRELILPEALEGLWEDGDDSLWFINLNVCPNCEYWQKHEDEPFNDECMMCERSEWVEIDVMGDLSEFTEQDVNFDLITGESQVWREQEDGRIVKDPNWNQGLVDVLKLSELLPGEGKDITQPLQDAGVL